MCICAYVYIYVYMYIYACVYIYTHVLLELPTFQECPRLKRCWFECKLTKNSGLFSSWLPPKLIVTLLNVLVKQNWAKVGISSQIIVTSANEYVITAVTKTSTSTNYGRNLKEFRHLKTHYVSANKWFQERQKKLDELTVAKHSSVTLY